METINILKGPFAKYFPETGLMIISQRVDKFLSNLSNPGFSTLEDNIISFYHELIHHLQTISSIHPYLNSNKQLTHIASIVKSEDRKNLIAHIREYLRLKESIRYRAFGISTLDLYEGVAVLESYKIIDKGISVSKFLSFRDYYFPGKANSPYRRTFDVMASVCGAENTFDLLAPITFMSLQGDIPGQSFELLIQNPAIRSGDLIGCSIEEILEKLEWNIEEFGLFRKLRTVHPAQRHYIFYPMMCELSNKASFPDLLNVFARPHRLNSEEFADLQEWLFPPLILGPYTFNEISSGVAFGEAKDNDIRDLVLVFTAYMFLVDSLVYDVKRYLPCPHQNCPNHSTNLCTGWFVPPRDYNSCGFRDYLRQFAGLDIFEVKQRFERNINKNELEKMKDFDSIQDIFPGVRLLLENVESAAEKLDSKLYLDPVDNDNVLMVNCKCGRVSLLKVSKRRMQESFFVTCPYCGAENKISLDRVAILHFEEE